MGYEDAYKIIKARQGDYSTVLPDLTERQSNTQSLVELRHLLEMTLVREYDDWYTGTPEKNISQAIHAYVANLGKSENRPTIQLRRVAAVLGWVYSCLDHDTGDAYLLLEQVAATIPKHEPERFLPEYIRTELVDALARWRDARGVPPSLESLDPAEVQVWHEITRWEVKPQTAFSDLWDKLADAADRAAEAVPDSIKTAIADALRGGLTALQDATEYAVREQAVIDEVRASGHSVQSIQDLASVPIDVLDRISRNSMQGGKVLAGLEGAGCGFGGLVFVAADIPALMAINIRFISQVACTYGFSTKEPTEREFVLNLIGYSAASQGAKVEFLRELNRISIAVAKRATWKQLQQQGLVRLMQKIAQELGIRLTKRKLMQTIPVVGAAVGGGVNYAFTHDNLEAARMMFRKRFLLRKCYQP